MSRLGKTKKGFKVMGAAFNYLPPPSGVFVPMCFCGDACKVAKSDEEETYNQKY